MSVRFRDYIYKYIRVYLAVINKFRGNGQYTVAVTNIVMSRRASKVGGYIDALKRNIYTR